LDLNALVVAEAELLCELLALVETDSGSIFVVDLVVVELVEESEQLLLALLLDAEASVDYAEQNPVFFLDRN
jgi:hypothetical protein